MAEWLAEWGKPPRRRVKSLWLPPTLVLRQAVSAIYLGRLTKWRYLPYWVAHYGFRCLPGAAGSRGMGCIGFPAHPVWEMTAACNLKCIHCHVPNRPIGAELSTAEAKSLLDQLAGISEFRMMAYTGGEPLLRRDLFELLAYSQRLGFANTIATNATLVDDTAARQLKRYGTVIAAVSLDGDAQTHDAIRKSPGAYLAALHGMRALRRAGILLHINITAMEHNIGRMAEVMAQVEELGTSILLIYQLVPVGRGGDIKTSVLSKEDNECLMRLMAQAQTKSRAILEPVAGPQYWPYLLKEAGITSGLALLVARQVFHGCAAGRGFVYIKPDGEVLPCPFVNISAGNIRETPFAAIWRDAEVFRTLRTRRQRLTGQCGDCEYESICGGCRGRALAASGDLFAEDPSCFLRR